MKRPAQRGILLLPVALTLALVGILAYTMTHEGSMQVSNVDAEYDMEVARYLTESGLHLAKWQNEKAGCTSEVSFGTVDLPGGRLVARTMERKDKGVLLASLTATTGRGTVRSLSEQQTTVYNFAEVKELIFKNSDGTDTMMEKGIATNFGNMESFQLTDDQSRALIKYSMPGELDNTSVLSAQLTLMLYDTNSTQAGRFMTAHRVTRDWAPGVTWDATAWANKGGDFAPAASASVTIAGGTPKTYNVAIDALVDGWASKKLDNQGLLLKSSGLQNDRFYSLDAAIIANRPKLVVRYHPRC